MQINDNFIKLVKRYTKVSYPTLLIYILLFLFPKYNFPSRSFSTCNRNQQRRLQFENSASNYLKKIYDAE